MLTWCYEPPKLPGRPGGTGRPGSAISPRIGAVWWHFSSLGSILRPGEPLGGQFSFPWATWAFFEASWAAFCGVLDVLRGPGGRKRTHWVLQGPQNGPKMTPESGPNVLKSYVQNRCLLFLTVGTHLGSFWGCFFALVEAWEGLTGPAWKCENMHGVEARARFSRFRWL